MLQEEVAIRSNSLTMRKDGYKRIIKATLGSIFKSIFPSLSAKKNIRIILMYHRVVNNLPRGLFDSGMYVTVNSLDKHIRELIQYFDVVSLQEMFDNCKREKNLCAITFDDGWLDNYELAYPILKKYNVPATVFLPVDYVGTKRKFWFQSFWDIANCSANDGCLDDFINYLVSFFPSSLALKKSYKNLKELSWDLKFLNGYDLEMIMNEAYKKFPVEITEQRNVMNWEEVSEMEQNGIYFGSHGLNHYIIPLLDYDLKKKEIVESLNKLRERLENVAPFFSYPNGDWDDESVVLVSAAGYKGAITTRLGLNSHNTDPFALNRIAIHEDISSSAPLFWFRILQAVMARS